MRLTIFGVNGPYPGPDGVCSGYLVSDRSAHLMMDCGSGVLAKVSRWPGIEALSAIILSHLHFDHMSDMLPLAYALESAGRRLPVYAPDAPAAQAALLLGGRFDLFPIKDMSIGPFRVNFLRAVHPVEAYSIGVEAGGRRLVYTGDTNLNPALVPFAQGADVLLADAGLLERDWSASASHLSARKCAELAAAAGVKALILTHLSPRYDPDELLEEARAVYPGAQIARPGLSVEI
jgi:ribonuclease BN (tRNA processing enzyme)